MPSTGVVYVHRGAVSERAAHDHATCTQIARRLAELKGYRFAGDFDERSAVPGDRYFVPTDTLIGTDTETNGDSFRSDDGGVTFVPEPNALNYFFELVSRP